MVNQTDVGRYLENWQDEIESAFLYQALSRAEPQPALSEVYRRLAITENTRREVEEVPDEEEEELALIYEAKGLPEAQAWTLASRIMSNRNTALDTLAREELGIDPQELGGSAWIAAATSFLLFTLGAIVPVAPFLFLQGIHAVYLSLVLSGGALFLIGAGITLLTGRSILYSGIRQVVFGFAAAGVTFAIGRLLGVSISG